jgi:phosphoenolpyruvate-protein kinase (PTS system EI component)
MGGWTWSSEFSYLLVQIQCHPPCVLKRKFAVTFQHGLSVGVGVGGEMMKAPTSVVRRVLLPAGVRALAMANAATSDAKSQVNGIRSQKSARRRHGYGAFAQSNNFFA